MTVTLNPGVYRINETQDLGYSSSMSGDCNSDGLITLNPGDNKSCTITNDDVPVTENSSLTLIKIVVNNDSCILGPSSFTLRINETEVEEGIPIQLSPGVYNVNEIPNPHYFATFYGDCDSKGNVVLGQKQNKTCIIVNDDITQGIINGMKFRDFNGNGIKDVNDTGLSTWRIYIDSNNNGFFEKNEKFAITTGNGSYSLKNLDFGTYIIREVPKSGWTPTYPPEGKYVIDIDKSGMVVNGIDFGNKRN